MILCRTFIKTSEDSKERCTEIHKIAFLHLFLALVCVGSMYFHVFSLNCPFGFLGFPLLDTNNSCCNFVLPLISSSLAFASTLSISCSANSHPYEYTTRSNRPFYVLERCNC